MTVGQRRLRLDRSTAGLKVIMRESKHTKYAPEAIRLAIIILRHACSGTARPTSSRRISSRHTSSNFQKCSVHLSGREWSPKFCPTLRLNWPKPLANYSVLTHHRHLPPRMMSWLRVQQKNLRHLASWCACQAISSTEKLPFSLATEWMLIR